MATEPLIRNISDTALWVAVYRARESERKDAVFRDPYARKMAGERGEQIAQAQRFSAKHEWSFVARTWLIDHFVNQEVAAGADAVLNLACGLDFASVPVECAAGVALDRSGSAAASRL